MTGLDCRIVLIRHGQTPCTVAGRFCGAHEPTLTCLGEEVAARLVGHPSLVGVELLVSSPAIRARRTATVIGAGLGLVPNVDDRLRELSFGDWENLLPADVETQQAYREWVRDPALYAPPGGESGLAVQARAVEAVRDIARGRTSVALVTHKAPIRLILAFFLGLPASRYRSIGEVNVGSVTELDLTGEQPALKRLANVAHLPPQWREMPDTATAVCGEDSR